RCRRPPRHLHRRLRAGGAPLRHARAGRVPAAALSRRRGRSDGADVHREDLMSDTFIEVASIDYPIIDSDAHVNEPPELWQERVPSRLRTRAPKVLHTEEGDVWSFDDGKKLRPLGLTATAGLSYLQFKASGLRYDEIRPGSFDTAARLRDLDADGLY